MKLLEQNISWFDIESKQYFEKQTKLEEVISSFLSRYGIKFPNKY